MKRMQVNYLACLWIIGFMMLSGAGAPVLAHSTKGRIKAPLEKEAISIDDIAYFAESYVHRRLYHDNTRKTENRFFLKEFVALDRKGGTADIRFVVLDKNKNTTFTDSLCIARGKNGVWHYQPPGGEPPIEIHTYAPKGAYYREKYGTRGFIAAGVLGCGLLVRAWYMKRRRAALAIRDENNKTACQDANDA